MIFEKVVAGLAETYKAAGGDCQYQLFENCEHEWVAKPGPQTVAALATATRPTPLTNGPAGTRVEVLLDRLPNWTISDELGGDTFERSYLLRGHRRLPIRW